MHEVEVSIVVSRPPREYLEHLSPRTILEAAEIYEIRGSEPLADGEDVPVAFEDTEMTIRFSRLENGYEYTFVDATDMFEDRHSKITVDGDEVTRLTGVTRYTFDSVWSFLLDRLGRGMVTKELETTIRNLADGVEDEPIDEFARDADREA